MTRSFRLFYSKKMKNRCEHLRECGIKPAPYAWFWWTDTNGNLHRVTSVDTNSPSWDDAVDLGEAGRHVASCPPVFTRKQAEEILSIKTTGTKQ